MEPDTSPHELVDCEEIVCRLALKKDFLADESVDAFLLRPSDKGRLSVFRLAKVSVSGCSATFNKVHGSYSLHSGRIRTVSGVGLQPLEVIVDESPSDKCPGHSSILNLPDPQLAFEDAQRAASLLKRQSRRLS
jgi:hypothetical protein